MQDLISFQGNNLAKLHFSHFLTFKYFGSDVANPEYIILWWLKMANCEYAFWVYEKNNCSLSNDSPNKKFNYNHIHLLVSGKDDLPENLAKIGLLKTKKDIRRDVLIKREYDSGFRDVKVDIPCFELTNKSIRIYLEVISDPKNSCIYLYKYNKDNFNDKFVQFGNDDGIIPLKINNMNSITKSELAKHYGVCYLTFKKWLNDSGFTDLFNHRKLKPNEIEMIVNEFGKPKKPL